MDKLRLSIAREEIINFALNQTDISDHLLTIFKNTIEQNPELIVELGVIGGNSNFVFRKVTEILEGCQLISIDTENVEYTKNPKWLFVEGEDIEIARNFKAITKKPIDVLFIDTSHQYGHTKQEIDSWFPLLNKSCTIIFHDTNLYSEGLTKKGEVIKGWNNNRAVIRAIEEYLELKIDETKEQETKQGKWNIWHYPYCHGLTILKR